jgi:hypothetical protein
MLAMSVSWMDSVGATLAKTASALELVTDFLAIKQHQLAIMDSFATRPIGVNHNSKR